jgi:hypothetical protein
MIEVGVVPAPRGTGVERRATMLATNGPTGSGMDRSVGSEDTRAAEGHSEDDILEDYVDRALDIPGGRHLAAFLDTEHHQDIVWRRLRLAAMHENPTPLPRAPRIVVELRSGALATAVEGGLREHGYQVAVCSPGEFRDGRCPLVEGRGCPLADEADVILHALGTEDPEGREVLEEHRKAHPRIPTVVVARTEGDQLVQDGPGQIMIGGALTRESLLGAIEGVLQASRSTD